MIKYLLIPLLLLTTVNSFAQSLIPFEFKSEDENRLLKENDSFKYYVASGDTLNTVGINEEGQYYKLLNKDLKVIAAGSFVMEGDKFLQDGKWFEKYDNGKLKLTGSYYLNLPVGTWQEYYQNGKPKTLCSYTIFIDNGFLSYCLSGTYQEYYQNGLLKVSGIYMASIVPVKDTIDVVDPVTGAEVRKYMTHNRVAPVKAGKWEYYDEHGEAEKKDE